MPRIPMQSTCMDVTQRRQHGESHDSGHALYLTVKCSPRTVDAMPVPNDHVQVVHDQLDVAQRMDDDLSARSPMSASQLAAGHANMQSVLLGGQLHALLAIHEQLQRIADALQPEQRLIRQPAP